MRTDVRAKAVLWIAAVAFAGAGVARGEEEELRVGVYRVWERLLLERFGYDRDPYSWRWTETERKEDARKRATARAKLDALLVEEGSFRGWHDVGMLAGNWLGIAVPSEGWVMWRARESVLAAKLEPGEIEILDGFFGSTPNGELPLMVDLRLSCVSVDAAKQPRALFGGGAVGAADVARMKPEMVDRLGLKGRSGQRAKVEGADSSLEIDAVVGIHGRILDLNFVYELARAEGPRFKITTAVTLAAGGATVVELGYAAGVDPKVYYLVLEAEVVPLRLDALRGEAE